MREINKSLLIFNFLLLFAAGFSNGAYATVTEQDGKTYSLQCRESSVEWIFERLESMSGYSFLYQSSDIKTLKKVTQNFQKVPLTDIITFCLKESGLSFEIRNKQVVIFPTPKENKPAPAKSPKNPVKGKITDRRGEPLAGANILIKGTQKGIISDENGEYEIDASESSTLIFYFMGFQKKEARVSGRSRIDIILEEEAATLKEVTVKAGYYEVKKSEMTGSIGRVDAKIIEKQPVLNPIAAISGRITGAYIQQTTGIPGGDFNIQIRGINNLRSDGNEPLYIVDGVPFSTEKVSTGINAGGILGSGASPLAGINNSDIESIEILKDADATAIYGSRGANGVVLITTKRGKSGKTTLNLDLYTGGGKAPMIKLLKTPEYLAMRREAFLNDGINPSSDPSSEFYAPDLTLWDQNRYTDWQKVLIGGTAKSTSLQASLTGGSENTQFLFSAGYRRETTVFPADFGYTKGSFHLAVNHKTGDGKLSVNVSVSGTSDKNTNTQIDLVNTSRRLAPNAPALYNEDGTLNWENSTWDNPLAGLFRKYNGETTTIIANSVIGYKILENLELKCNFGLTQLQSNERTTIPSTISDPALGRTSANSSVIDGRGTNSSWIAEPQISYAVKIWQGELNVMAGLSFQEQNLERNADSYSDFPSNSMLENLTMAKNKFNYEFTLSKYRYAALFGRINYNIKKKYFINLTGRRDGSSRFGPGNQFGNFGAAGVAWVFSKEPWFQNRIRFINFGKLRLSYGSTGNDQIGNYMFLDTYSAVSNTMNQYDGITGLGTTRLFNSQYSWEINNKLEGAIELEFLHGRIGAEIGGYLNRCSNQLLNYTLPTTTGFSGINSNFPATVQNSGIELELSSVNIQKSKLRWTTAFNITIPRNKLVAFPGLESSSYRYQYIVGESVYIRKFYECTGVDPQTGYYTFKDYNGDGIIKSPDDNQKVKFVGQDFYGGLTNTLSYKGWSFEIFLQFVKQSGYNYWYNGARPGGFVNMPTYILELNRWQKPGDIADIQKLSVLSSGQGYNSFDNYRWSDATVTDASFIRVKNISLSYQFPEKWLKGFSCRAYLQAQNLFVLTRYDGYDPESQTTGLGPLKMLTAGLQLSF